MANRFTVSTIFRGIDRMSAPISRIQNRIGTMTRAVNMRLRSIRRSSEQVVGGLKKIGQRALIVGTIAAAGLGQAAAAGINFEQTMVNASAKMGESAKRGTENFKLMEDAAKLMGSTTEFTATQSAEALNFLAMAGFNAQQSVAALPGVIDLATASQTDLATATDIATDTLGAFGLESKNSVQLAKNLARVNDVLAKTATTSNTSITQLFEAMKKGGPIATATGADIETVAAMIGTMANAGIKADIAGTAVANSFLNLSSPASGALKVMKRLGIQFKDTATGGLKDMPDLIDEFNNKTKDLTKTQKLAALEALFGREGLAGTAKVMSQGGDALRLYRDRLRQANGAAADMAKEMRDTTRGSLNALNSAVEGVSITLFGMTQGPMKDAIDLTTMWVRENGDMIAQNIGGFFLSIAENIDTVVASLKLIGGVVVGLWAFNTALAAVQATMAVIAFLSTPFGLVVLAAASLAAIGIAIYNNWEPLKVLFTDIWAVLKKINDFEGLTQKGGMFSAGNMFGDNAVTNFLDTPINELFGGGKSDTPQVAPPAVSSPLNRQASILEERNTTNKTEVVIRDETGRAEAAPNAAASGVTVAQTGGF